MTQGNTCTRITDLTNNTCNNSGDKKISMCVTTTSYVSNY